MRTKRKLLSECEYDIPVEGGGMTILSESRVLEAMDLYAKQQSMAFDKWKKLNAWEISKNGKYVNMISCRQASFPELYDIFNELNKEK